MQGTLTTSILQFVISMEIVKTNTSFLAQCSSWHSSFFIAIEICDLISIMFFLFFNSINDAVTYDRGFF